MTSRMATPEETRTRFGKPIILAARATQAAEMMGVSRSSFYVNVKLGIYPPARYANGTPVWIVKELNAALEAMPTTRPKDKNSKINRVNN